MVNAFCVICRDEISIHGESIVNRKFNEERHNDQVQGSSSSSSFSLNGDMEEDFMVATRCGHLFHNNCLQKWFKVEETNERNTYFRIYLMQEDPQTEEMSASRIYSQTCPYCKDMLLSDSGSCIKLYPIEAPSESEQEVEANWTDEAYKKAEFDKVNAEIKELKKKYDSLIKFHEEEILAYDSEVKQLKAKLENTEEEHSEIEDKWISAMRKLDSDHKKSKAFFFGIFETLGYHIPSLPLPDLSIANLVGQVLENREIVLDEPDKVIVTPDFNKTISGNTPGPSRSITTSHSSHSHANTNNNATGDIQVDSKAKLEVGDRVVWSRQIENPMIGIVKWKGKVRCNWTAGIEFEQPIGQNERLIQNIKSLFSCKDGHGRLVQMDELVQYDDFFPHLNVSNHDEDTSNDTELISLPISSTSDPVEPLNSKDVTSKIIGKTKKLKKFPRFLRRILPWK